MQGPTSAGKTSLIEFVAKKSGNYCLRINNHEHTDLQEYIGTYAVDVSGKLTFKEGVLVQAMRNGYWIILDELNLAPSDILEALNRVLDDNRELFITETQELVKAHPNFMLFATQNPPGLYGGRKILSRAFKNRFIELHFSEIPETELETILEKRCQIPKSYSRKMVKTMSELQTNRHSMANCSFTLRDLFRWGNRYTNSNPELMKVVSDWGQYLADEGFLVLSSKIRNNNEVNNIIEAIFRNFRKKVVPANLFDLHENTSVVTKPLLRSIAEHPQCRNIHWTLNIRQMAVLAGKAFEFNEPVLLVGPTGCGKTSICQILADIALKQLRILNCHMHTESADFLGGLRPFRGDQSNAKSRQLFEWYDGPLIEAMLEGSFFLADEISLAEDAVLERLNSVLEPEKTILLTERGGCIENSKGESIRNTFSRFVIKAKNGFQFMATMNPGGDFGKRELSPALRNRFTEVWCSSDNTEVDLINIAVHEIQKGIKNSEINFSDKEVQNVAIIVARTIKFISTNIKKFNYSVRDILSWIQFILTNSKFGGKKSGLIPLHEAILIGLDILFLDSLEMLLDSDYANMEINRSTILSFVICELKNRFESIPDTWNCDNRNFDIIFESENKFGIEPFFVTINPRKCVPKITFEFTAPTTQKNLFRLLSAMSLPKAILLEGPPGVGKTSLIENLGAVIGYEIVRINLCEHTDLTDLFGSDQPSDENGIFENHLENSDRSQNCKVGSFIWRDGPLLAALKRPNTWILLDELNLAPQSVLEGLNAILDHRGEVYIPELNKTFKLNVGTRIFASQNPFQQGGGRKGLPQSFLNRFTKVYLKKLTSADLCHIIDVNYVDFFNQFREYLLLEHANNCNVSARSYFDSWEYGTKFDCSNRMITFSEKLDHGITNLEFGYKGGPYETNLRDLFKWCDMIFSDSAGFVLNDGERDYEKRYNSFILNLYEKMKLVYYHRMRTETDKEYIRNIFAMTFNCDADSLEKISSDVSCYWNDEHIYLNNFRIDTNNFGMESYVQHQKSPFLLQSQRELLKSLAECVALKTPIIICGPNDR